MGSVMFLRASSVYIVYEEQYVGVIYFPAQSSFTKPLVSNSWRNRLS